MKWSLSTNWLARRVESGEEIAERASAMGFDEMELGFHTTVEQAAGFRRRLDLIRVGSVHAFCPVPISAPQGHPELYSLASFDEDARALARFHVKKNIEFAASIGADTVVLHAGRVSFSTFLRRGFDSGTLRAALSSAKGDLSDRRYAKLLARARRIRTERGARLLPLFRKELDALLPDLERCGVTLALENLPYLEGFPDESETKSICDALPGAPVKGWFDTGHDRVREMHGWTSSERPERDALHFAGMHLNDVVDYNDDHLAPGEGKVDFAALAPLARAVGHVVFEPHSHVGEESLAKGLEYMKSLEGYAN